MKTIVTGGRSRAPGQSYHLLHSRVIHIGTCCCLAVLLCWTSTLSLGQNKAFTNDDILKMVRLTSPSTGISTSYDQ